MRAAVIGSSGGMGSFFVRYFLSKGYSVSGSDIRPSRISSRRFTFFRSNVEAAKDSDLVLIASPIDSTVENVEDCLDGIRRGATLIEISSVKGKILPRVRRLLQGREVNLLSLHPLFGPSLKTGSAMKMLVVGSERGREMENASRVFPDATLVSVREKDHDRLVAISLSLTHLVNIVYAQTISRFMTPADFRKISTPTSAVQLALTEGVLSNDPALYSYIQIENQNSEEVLKVLAGELKEVLHMIRIKDRGSFEELYRNLRARYLQDTSRTEALSKIYEAFDSVKE